jgi:hypothetical protein
MMAGFMYLSRVPNKVSLSVGRAGIYRLLSGIHHGCGRINALHSSCYAFRNAGRKAGAAPRHTPTPTCASATWNLSLSLSVLRHTPHPPTCASATWAASTVLSARSTSLSLDLREDSRWVMRDLSPASSPASSCYYMRA